MKKLLKKILPEEFISIYHYILAITAALVYGLPSRKMVVIGITGTKGKTTTANFIWSALNETKEKAGLVGTANIRIGDQEVLNKYHMTMPGRLTLQKLLHQMQKAGCKYCIVEATSEGIKQFRHKGIDFDICIFTNLYREHLPSHGGSFEKYKEAKGKLFASLKGSRKKNIAGVSVAKTIIANFDDQHKDYYLSFWSDNKVTYGINDGADFKAEKVSSNTSGVSLEVKGESYALNILGEFNVYNALPAIAVGSLLNVSSETIRRGLSKLQSIPGRMEIIENNRGIKILVDYAHQKESMDALLDAAQKMKHENEKVIVLLGAEGGGRDKAKRPTMGESAAKKADYVIVSNVDPYEDDPTEIAEDIAVVAEQFGKVRNENLFVIEDRRAGIKKCLELAQANDIVLITGKGAEQSITIGGKTTYWDDRVVVREELIHI